MENNFENFSDEMLERTYIQMVRSTFSSPSQSTTEIREEIKRRKSHPLSGVLDSTK